MIPDPEFDDTYRAEATAHTQQFLDEVTTAARRHHITGLVVAGIYEKGDRFRPVSRSVLESRMNSLATGIALLGAAVTIMKTIEDAVGMSAQTAHEIINDVAGNPKVTQGERIPN